MNKRKGLDLTARTARDLQPEQWASRPVSSKRGAGILQARGLQSGVTYYLRITAHGRRHRIVLGALPYKEAVQRAGELSVRYLKGERGLYAALKAERAKQEREYTDATSRTLGALLEAYCDDMERRGRVRVNDVRRAVNLHVRKAWPRLWGTPADKVTADDVVAVVARPYDAGKHDTARQLRAYIRAAYTAAVRARHNPAAMPALRALHVTSNPAADIAPMGTSGKRVRNLSVDELRAYWRRIAALPGIDGALLQFHLLTGGQRIEQLARATVDDYDADAGTLRLYDGKGRRQAPRVHLVPLIPPAVEAMRAMHGQRYVFSVTAGKSGTSYNSLRDRLRVVVAAMQGAGELEATFTPGDVRRTVETRLAAAKIHKDIRAQLQSHGLGGVQDKHYDEYEYLPEKRAALETLYRIATGASADVVPIRRNA